MAMHAGLLSIPTSWSKVLEAGHSAGFAARHHLLVRYHEAILNYLRAKLPWDEKGADQLYSDFAIRVLEIQWQGADGVVALWHCAQIQSFDDDDVLL